MAKPERILYLKQEPKVKGGDGRGERSHVRVHSARIGRVDNTNLIQKGGRKVALYHASHIHSYLKGKGRGITPVRTPTS